MNSQQLKELIDYVMKNNSWKECSYLMEGRQQPKYVDVELKFCLDTRDGIVWRVGFREWSKNITYFDVETEEDLQVVYEWLDKVDNRWLERSNNENI